MRHKQGCFYLFSCNWVLNEADTIKFNTDLLEHRPIILYMEEMAWGLLSEIKLKVRLNT
jgi:hypothetical protein